MSEDLETSEELEVRAETKPQEFDFLGRGIDAGFRIATFADTDKLAISAELALLLCDSATHGALNARMHYIGREALKGVLNGRPYPVIVLDTEKSISRKEVRQHERTLLGLGDTKPEQLKVFLNAYFADEQMEYPTFESANGKPESYRLFTSAWNASVRETTEREKVEQESVDVVASPSKDDLSEDTMKLVRTKMHDYIHQSGQRRVRIQIIDRKNRSKE